MPILEHNHKILPTTRRTVTSTITAFQGKVQFSTDNGLTWTDEDSSQYHIYALLQWLKSRPFSEVPNSVDDAVSSINPHPALVPLIGIPDSIELDFTAISQLALPPCTVLGFYGQPSYTPISPFTTINTTERTLIQTTEITGFHRLYLSKRETIALVSGDLDLDKNLTIDGTYGVYGVELVDGTVVRTWDSIRYINDQTIINFDTNPTIEGKLLVSPRNLVSTKLRKVSALYIDKEYPISIVNSLGFVVTPNYKLNKGNVIINVKAYSEQPLSLLVPEFMLTKTSSTHSQLLVGTDTGSSGVTTKGKLFMVGKVSTPSSVTSVEVGVVPQQLGEIRIIRVTQLPSIALANSDVIYRVEDTKRLYQVNTNKTNFDEIGAGAIGSTLPIASQQWVDVNGTKWEIKIDPTFGGLVSTEVL